MGYGTTEPDNTHDNDDIVIGFWSSEKISTEGALLYVKTSACVSRREMIDFSLVCLATCQYIDILINTGTD